MATFRECVDIWIQKAEADSSIDLASTFKINLWPDFQATLSNIFNASPQFETTNSFVVEYLELELIGTIETMFKCSGMCETGLFYFSMPLNKGLPQKTCIHKITEFVQKETKSHSKICVLTGLLGLVIIFLHFALYGMQNVEKTYEYKENNQSG